MPIEISPGQIIWVDCADEEEVPKSDENNLVLDFPGPETVHGKPSKAEIQKNHLMEVQLTKKNLRKKAKNKVERAENSQNSAELSKPEEVKSEVQKIRSQIFENQEFVQLTKKKAEIDKKARIGHSIGNWA